MENPKQKFLFPEGGILPEGPEGRGRAYPGWGGAREGAGAKRKRWREGAPHRRRLSPQGWSAHHVTLSVKKGCPNLRAQETFFWTLQVFQEEKERPGFRVVAWTLQRNHLHLLVEASSRESLSRSLQGIQVRLARGWNRTWGRKGKIFAGRFHSRVLENLRDGRRVLAYVLKNHLRHGVRVPWALDPLSSGLWMDVWLEREAWLEERRRFKVEGDPSPVAAPGTDVLRLAVFPGSLSLWGRPRGYFRDEFLEMRKASGKGGSSRQPALFP